MVQPTRRERPVRTLVVLGALIAALFGSLLVGANVGDASFAPKLALDLEGGTQIVLTPVAEDEGKITDKTISEAINVIRQRVDSSGIAEVEITSQGGRNIVVSIPGNPTEETLQLVRKSAKMEFRPVLAYTSPEPTTDPSAAPTDGATPPSDQPTKAAPDSPSDAEYYVTPKVQADFLAFDCTDPANLTDEVQADPAKALVTCDQEGTAKYLLGPVEIEGKQINSAISGLGTGPNGTITNEQVVNIEFNSEGAREFRVVTERLQALTSPQNQFAMVLDGQVISAPKLDPGVIITDGQAQISGNFTRASAASLANQLSFGALPLSFTVQSESEVSATLGSEQLQKGLLAGVIGLLLVVVYSMFQYRALGLVTVASLVLAAVLTYGVIAVLSWTQGYRLSLSGVAGLIVAIGITADSFIVYFERIRDELRDGRTLVGAIDKGWNRARRTILASDAVNFLAAVVLYFLAVGGVQGFAFTLGLTTLIDVVIVFCFTHPVMTLLGRTKFFREGHAWSGLDPRRLGASLPRYAGRGRVAGGPAAAATGATAAGASAVDSDDDQDLRVPVGVRPSADGMTIAERRAAERAAQSEAAPSEGAALEGAPPSDDDSGTPSDAGRSGRTERNEH